MIPGTDSSVISQLNLDKVWAFCNTKIVHKT